MARQQNQIETIVDLVNAIFYCDARHTASLLKLDVHSGNHLIATKIHTEKQVFPARISTRRALGSAPPPSSAQYAANSAPLELIKRANQA
jgi:hypothetical protein